MVPSIVTAGGQRHELGSDGWTLAALLPERSLDNQHNQADTVFEITFDLVLVPPNEARKAMSPGGRTQPTDETQPEPSANAGGVSGSAIATNTQEELSQ